MVEDNLSCTFQEHLFLAKIRPGEGGCWLWGGAVSWGYGKFGVRRKADGKRFMAMVHRLAYEMWVGPIPEGLDLDHLCRVRNCLNPEHLEPVTRKENLRRGIGAQLSSERQLSKTECRNGHLYTEATMYIDYRGLRKCRICDRAKKLRYRLKESTSGQ